jgi:phage replication O-like protein O
MNYKHSTQIPNKLFDVYLKSLSKSELKILLTIMRQTYGWIHPKTKQRKKRDRISHSQFIQKTGLSRRSVIETLQTLIKKGLIQITDFNYNVLDCPTKRKGKKQLFYSIGTRYGRHGKAKMRMNKVTRIDKIFDVRMQK